MKKKTIIALTVTALAILAGCSSTYQSGSGTILSREMQYRTLAIVTDRETGCQYISAIDAGITPRLDGNGNQVGCKK
jgi:uncharacterized protein YceK